jgi:transcription initiation factor IIE alpha subunit
MGTRRSVSAKIAVRLSADEIAVVCHCINEALDALTDDEFAQRVGADRQQARALLGRLSDRRTAAKQADGDGAGG